MTRPTCRSATTSAMSPMTSISTSPTTASRLSIYIGQVSVWDFPPSSPSYSPLRLSQDVAMSGDVVNTSHLPDTWNCYGLSSMAQQRPSALRPTNSPARNRDLLRPFSPPPFSMYPHCLPLQTTGSSSSLLSFLPEAPLPTPSSATPQASPLPPVVYQDVPLPMAAVPLPSSPLPTPAFNSHTWTHAPLTSFLPLPRPSSSFPRSGPPAFTPRPRPLNHSPFFPHTLSVTTTMQLLTVPPRLTLWLIYLCDFDYD